MFARALVRAFEPKGFDDLVAFRFPLVPGDLEVIEREVGAFTGREPLSEQAAEFDGFANSPLVRDLVQRCAVAATLAHDDEESRRMGRAELGV